MTGAPLEPVERCKHYARLKTSENGIWTHLDMAMERSCIRCGERMVFVSATDNARLASEVRAGEGMVTTRQKERKRGKC